jgi:hypothetical protein
MKLTERTRGLFLEDIKQTEIRFAHMSGKPTGSKYDDPNKPKYEYVVWIDDQDILNRLKEMNITISEKIDEETGASRFSVRFKAYPKTKVNRLSGKEEQYPMVMLKNGDTNIRLNKDSFVLVDSSRMLSVDIQFHLYQYDDRKPDCIAAIDKLWCVVDETAGMYDDSYLEEKHGYLQEDMASGDEEELPF